MRTVLLLALLALTAACREPEIDNDGDGVPDKADCDDADASVFPGATEVCDGLDNDCNGTVDDETVDASTWYLDADGDGAGGGETATACEAPEGYLADTGDCDDADATSFPGADEVCDGADNDCDGSVDEEAMDAPTWWPDGDGDGYGAAAGATESCEQPTGYADNDADCDDTDERYHPGATEDDCTDPEDYNCDGSVGYADADADGWPACQDCDDAEPLARPDGTEVCDGIDNDCNGTTDGAEAVDASTWYADTDADGYGDAAVSTEDCDQPEGYVADATDCDDDDATAYPGAAETCDEVDNDCDGSVDEDAVGAPTWYADDDGDGYGDATSTTSACDQPTGYVSDATDCDDLDATSHPGGTEVCDGADNDCDGTVDDSATDAPTWYADADEDGYGDASTSLVVCDQPSGYVLDDEDCDDTDGDVHPGQYEICNDVDDDCDGTLDEDDAVDAGIWYLDADGDGYGDGSDTDTACDQPSGYVDNDEDCDDTDSSVSPGAVESCNSGVDDDCDGYADDDDPDGATGTSTWYMDLDGDGYGNPVYSTSACEEPSGYADNDDDCDDTEPLAYDGATESCDGADNDCDGDVDEGVLGTGTDCPADDCQAIYDDGSTTDGVYYVDPDGSGAWEAYCDLTRDGGGWTRLYSSHYPTWWSTSDWEYVGDPEDDDYSVLGYRDAFANSGVWEFRFEVGDSGDWTTGSSRSHYTIWTQEHDPFTDTTDGTDYTLIDGEESTTCSGFNGLHDKYYLDYGVYCMSSDVDSTDSSGCWWMQIVPLTQYHTASTHPGYLEGYSGPNTHTWHTLWIR